ncbi:MAG: hypothetical protein ABI359_03645 [Ginsengibacter sp.]
MSDLKEDDTTNDSGNEVKESTDFSISKQPQGEHTTPPNCKGEENPENPIKPKNKKWSISDKINIWMAAFTAGLFFITTYSTCLTRNAIISSDSTNVKYLDKIERLVTAFDTSANNGKKSLVLQDSSINAQINSIKETQQIFEKTNQPFLQLAEPVITTFKAGEPLEIRYTIVNLSNIPIKVINQKTNMIFRKKPPPLSEIKKFPKGKDNPVNYYVTIQDPFFSKFHFRPLKTEEYDAILNGPYFIYVLREITYENLVTNTMRKYLIYTEMKPIRNSPSYPNGTYYNFIYNENYNTK